MKNEDYLNIQGWMINELGLNNISHIAVFAVIYSFSRDGSSVFKGSQSYLANSTKLTRTSVNKILKTLESAGLIDRLEVDDPRVSAVNYRVSEKILQGVKNLTGGVNDLTGGVKKLNTIIQEDNTRDNTSIKKEIVERKNFNPAVGICAYECSKFFPEHLRPKTDSEIDGWRETIDKLNRIDNIPFQAIEQVVKWARSDSFWSANFLSLTKLRKKNKDGVPYIVVFAEKMRSTMKNSSTFKTGSAMDETMRLWQTS